MARRSRPLQVELTTAAQGPAVDALQALVAEGAGGWLNLFPEVEEDDVVAVTPSAVASLFRAPGPPIPQVTVIPARRSGRGHGLTEVGITHGVGTRVVSRLAGEGITLPEGWTVVQDHVRRGLVLRLPVEVDAATIVAWTLRAAEALCPVPITGAWLAEVHQP